MSEATTNYIVKEELPIAQNFKLLREDGLTRIQDISDYEWTNLNPSDPGVTILDQICYALTELGYCNDFPVKDLLTTSNGKLTIEDQYYLPEKILTTSPVSIEDYIKYLIDGVDYVSNAVMVPVKTNVSAYMVYLNINKSITSPKTIGLICDTAYYLLNNARNLCETFIVAPLESINVMLSGQIDIDKDVDIKSLLSKMQAKIDSHIFPNVKQMGYDKLKENGAATDAIFDGPILQNGWILSEDLKPKKDVLYVTEVNALMASINGVQAVTQLEFLNTESTSLVTSLDSQIINVDIIESVNNGKLKIYRNGKDIDEDITKEFVEATKKTYQLETNVEQKSVSAISVGPDLPKGRYRDINNYYSIQNTLPEVFRVGDNAIDSGATSYQTAQSRQLMGYLTLIDQVLANQFSQLANIGALFSFKNATTGAPSDRDFFYKTYNDPQKMKGSYPVPYESFAPTYFYQSLYHTPGIRPLLKNHAVFNFSVKYMSRTDLETRSWKDYINDPYNSYMWGLKNFIEDDEVSFTRRNEMLNHLLARHGESPIMIDAIIDGSKYTGDKIQDEIIFKSLLLQNLGWLSYYRQKAYNFIGADSIKIPEPDAFKNITFKNDFIFNSKLVDKLEKLHASDFVNYSGIELKLSLLFGLNPLYRDFIVDYGSNNLETFNLEKRQAEWLITKRKGCLFIETNILLQVAKYQAVIIQNSEYAKSYWYTDAGLDYKDALLIQNWLNTSDTKTIQNQLKGENTFLSINGKAYTLKRKELYLWSENWIQQALNSSEYSYAIKADWGESVCTYLEDPLFNNAVDVFFPNYIKTIDNDSFKERLGLFFESSGPIQIEFRRHFLCAEDLKYVILLFIICHNRLIYKDPNKALKTPKNVIGNILTKHAQKLAKLIIEINSKNE